MTEENTQNTLKTVFLDLNGVILTYRADEAMGRSDGEPQQADPLAVAAVNRICEQTGAKIIIISDLVEDDEEKNKGLQRDLVERCGLKQEHFHANWKLTKDGQQPASDDRETVEDALGQPRHRSSAERGDLIVERCQRQGWKPDNILILDDGQVVGLSPGCKERHVKPDTANGLSERDYGQINKMVGGKEKIDPMSRVRFATPRGGDGSQRGGRS